MSSEGRSIKDIKVEDVQKRRIPSKHYVYVINVLWSDGKRYIVYRRYSRFFDFQLSLLEKFPIDAGVVDPEKRIIPFLPGKIIFGRSHIREVALKRLGQIDEYCKALINLPPHISRDEEVFDFFEPDDDDFNPPTQQRQKQKTADNISGPTLAEQYVVIADYEKVDKWDLNLKAGMTLEVVEKSDSGWWFVNVDDKQGWVPSTYLERKDGLKENTAIRTNLGEDERYLSTENYTPVNSDEIGLEKGAVVEVLEKNLDGWWFVRCNNKEGIVPSTYLMKTEKAHIERVARASGVQIVGRLSDVSDLLKKSASSESVGDTRGNVQHILKKQRSLERGGSLRPPPRLNSITKASDDVINSLKRTEAHYITISEFTDSVGDGVTFGKGEVVEVFEKSDSGWWFVKINGKEGWAPATYIEKTHMVEIEEEDNVYHDIDNVDEAFQSSDEDEGIYEVPDPVPEVQENKNEHEHEDTNDHGPAVPMRTKVADLRGAVIRPNSKPPPPPVGLRPVTIDEDDKSLSGGPPVPPPKSSKDKPVVNNQNFTDVLKSKLSSVGPPPPPPKNLKPMKEKNALSPDATGKNLNNAENKTRNNQEPEEPKRYKYTDVIPKEQRQSTAESLADVLKSKFENKQDSGNKTNQPDDKGDNLSQSADLNTLNTGKEILCPQKKFEKPKPPKKNLSRLSQNHPRPVSKENSFEHKKGENCDANTTMGELKAKFEKHPQASAKKPMLKSKPNIPVDGRTSINKKPCVEIPSDSQDVRPVSGTASALKAMFEQSKTNLGAQQKTRNSSTGSNSSRTSNIAAKFNAVNESDNKCENTSRPPVLPSKPKMAVKPSPLLPHKPVQSNSTKAALPAKTNSSKPTTSNKPKVPIPSKVDKNHNEMESKEQGKLAGLTKTIASKIESNLSMNKTVPVPPGKDYEMLSNFSTPCYKAVADYTATNQEEVSICAGEVVDVIEQTKDWWFVRVRGEEGWAPGSYIEECEIDMNDDVFHKQYKAVSDFATAADGEIGLKTGDLLEVIEETDTGWWFVKNGGLEGWAPSAYLEPV